MLLFFPHHTKTQHQQSKAPKAAQKPAFQAVPNNQSNSKNRNAAAMEIILPAHKYTPVSNL